MSVPRFAAATKIREPRRAPAGMALALAGLVSADSFIACPDCDAFQRLSPGARAACVRCGAVLAPGRAGGSGGGRAGDRALAFTLAAIPLVVASNVLPLVRMDSPSGLIETTVIGAAGALWEQGMGMLALLVLLMATVLPAVRIGSAALLLLGARHTRLRCASAFLFQVLEATRPWAQTEILLAGMLVAYGKLASVFPLAPGIGLPCLVGCLLLERAASASLH